MALHPSWCGASRLRKLNIEGFPERKVVQIDLRHHDRSWERRDSEGEWRSISPEKAAPLELILSSKLRQYRDVVEPKSGKAKLVFINLQKRLLSSFEAFYRTLQAHARSVGKAAAAETPTPAQAPLLTTEDDENGIDDDAEEQTDAEAIESASKVLPTPEAKARELLNELVSLAEQYRGAPDAKVLARASRRLALRRQDRAGVELRRLPQREFLEVRGSEAGQRLRYFSCQSSKTRSVQRSFRWSRTPSACSRSSF